MRWLLVVSLWMCHAASLISQVGQWDLIHYSRENGLPSDKVYGMIEDSQGFMWLATDVGLYRFDGSRCTYIDLPAETGRTLEAELSELYFDLKGILWIATSGDGLFSYNPSTTTTRHYKADLSDPFALPSSRTYGLFEDYRGDLWVSAHGQGLCRYDSTNDRFIRVRPYKDEAELRKYKGFQHMISDATQDNRDARYYWMATLRGLLRWDTREDVYVYYHPPDGITGLRAIYQDASGSIWGATWGYGLWKYVPGSGEWTMFRCSEEANSAFACLNASDIHGLDSSTLLIASETGIMTFNTVTQKFDTTRLHRSPARAEHFYSDSKGHLWILAPGDGLYMLHPARQMLHRQSLPSNIHRVAQHPKSGSVYAMSKDTVYMVSPEGEVRVIPLAYTENPEKPFLNEISFDENQQLWISDSYSLYHMPQGEDKLSPFQHPGIGTLIEKGYYWRAMPDGKGSYWFLSQGSGVWTLDLRTHALRHFDYEQGNPDALVHNYSIGAGMIDRDGDVWGSASSGIFYYNQEQAAFLNSDSPLLGSDNVAFGTPKSFAQDEMGVIWLGQFLDRVGTLSKGRLSGQLVELVPGLAAMPQAIITDMLFDDSGNLWVSSHSGIVRYVPENAEARLFGYEYGISDVTDLALCHDGRILATSKGDVLNFDPDSLPSDPVFAMPVITSFRIFDAQYQSGSGVRVPYVQDVTLRFTQNFFSFDFGAIDFVSQGPKEYAYMLEGLDREWNYPEQGRQYAAYTNVGGGRFVFRVKVRNPGSEWSPGEASLIVAVTPPLWQRPWFILLAALTTGILIWTLYRYRINEIKKKEELITVFNKQLAETEMKALRAQMNPHFLFNTLNAIKLYVQKNDQDMAVSYLTDFAKLIRQVLQNSGNTLIPLASELEALNLYIRIERMRFDATFDYQIEVDKDVSPEAIRIPPLLLQPYVENAIWHGLMHKHDKQGKLLVHVKRSGADLLCIVEDNGIGREAAGLIRSKSAEKNKSMGMKITQDRMDLTGRMSEMTFDVTIEDLKDEKGEAAGTRVVLRISPRHQ